MIKITERAAEKIRLSKSEEQKPDSAFLRVRVKRGGCSGFSYLLEFDDSTQEKDKEFSEHGVRLVIDNQSLLYLMGMTLDFEGGLNGQGFIFSNPNATKVCGCGSSFAV